ncbi:MAG: translation initiation factor IF-3 [Elusimicrobia bacterium]|nr:translation initiation factor IF-3 [Elusimicrobiota bacterium]
MYHDNRRIRINRYINVAQVRLIATDGTMVGVKPIYEAQNMARAAGLDLVEIAPMANPPVCKIMDFSKHLYELDKQARENRKKQKAGVLKEIRFNPRIARHDLETKIRHIEEFLKEQNKVRVTVVFHGRENQHRNLGEEILNNVKTTLSGVGVVEGRTQMMGNRMSIMLSPVQLAAKTAPRAAGGAKAPAAQPLKPAARLEPPKPATPGA